MTIHESEYQIIELDEKLLILQVTSKSETENMSVEEFKSEMLKYLEVLKMYKSKLIFWNVLDLQFIIVPEVQKWVDTNVASVEKQIWEKQAILMPKEMIAELSIQQVADEEHKREINIEMFDKEEDAIEWLVR